MREILFRGRGKRKDQNFFVYGDHYKSPDTGNVYIKEENFGVLIQVIPETVGQYTGLTDKNGVKIFKGDIVDLFGLRGEIVYECGAFGISFKPYINWNLIEARIPIITGERNELQFCYNDNFISLWELYWNFEQENDRLDILEIVGNVHDNPEMLNDTSGNGDANKL